MGSLREEAFVSLATTRRSGETVPTPVWVAPDPDDRDVLLVTTGAASGKVKRIRHTPEVTLQACDRRGRVRVGAPVVAARAEISEGAEAVERGSAAVKAKYGLQYSAMMLIEKVLTRGGRDRVILRLTDR